MTTQREKDRAIRKVETAIDMMVDIQDLGFGCDAVSRALEILNALRAQLENQP